MGDQAEETSCVSHEPGKKNEPFSFLHLRRSSLVEALTVSTVACECTNLLDPGASR